MLLFLFLFLFLFLSYIFSRPPLILPCEVSATVILSPHSLPTVTFCAGFLPLRGCMGRAAFLETLDRAPIASSSIPAPSTSVAFTFSTSAMPIAATSACSPIQMPAPLCRCHHRFYSLPLSAVPTFFPSSSSRTRDLVAAVACSADSIRWRTRASSSGTHGFLSIH